MVDEHLDARVADNIVANLVDSYGREIDGAGGGDTKGKLAANSMLGISKLPSEGTYQVCSPGL
jgi:hypothetical protein